MGIDRLDVFDPKARSTLEHRSRGADQFTGLARAVGKTLARCRQRTAQRKRAFALVRRQVRIARTHRKAIGLAHGRNRNNLEIEIEIDHHPLDRAQLLKILLAEERGIWLYDIEQLRHHGRDAAKMARAMVAAKSLGDFRRLDPGLQPRRKHHIGFRSEQYVDRNRAHQLAIALEVARIAGEILIWAKLRRVDEQRTREPRAEFAPLAHQREMSLVQKAHRGYECDR